MNLGNFENLFFFWGGMFWNCWNFWKIKHLIINQHFLTNYKAEEFFLKPRLTEARYEVSHDYGSRFGSYGVTLTAVVDASSPQDAMKKGHDKLETLSMSAQGKKLGVDELQDPDDEGKPAVKITSKPISFTDMKKF